MDETNVKCPICARTFASATREKLAYVDRKRNASDLMHRTARRELAERSTTPAQTLDVVVDSLASIIVAGTFEPEKTEPRVAIATVLQEAEREQREAQHLQRRNQLRTYRGLPVLERLQTEDEQILQDEDDDPEGIRRIMLDEAALILADAIQQP